MTSEPRIDRLETEVSQTGQRLAGVEGELRQIRERLNSLENTMNSRFNNQMTVNLLLWATTIGTIIGFFLTR